MRIVRPPSARDFYAGDCRKRLDKFLEEYAPTLNVPSNLHGAVLPHAGWTYSGTVAARTLYVLSQKCTPKTCIVFGADHTNVSMNTVYPEGSWWTPLGEIPIDEKTIHVLENDLKCILNYSTSAHRNEHSIEVIAPMLKYFWPNISMIPIIARSHESAGEMGKLIAQLLYEKRQDFIFLASSDLTHYGSMYGHIPAGIGPLGFEWMKENDQRLIHILYHMEVEKIMDEVKEHQNACGPGALTALLSALSVYNVKEGQLLMYTTSHGNQPTEEFRYGVGYAGILF